MKMKNKMALSNFVRPKSSSWFAGIKQTNNQKHRMFLRT